MPRKKARKAGITAVALDFNERMALLGVMPPESSRATMQVWDSLRRAVALSDAELRKIDWNERPDTCPTCQRAGQVFDTAKAAKLPRKRIEIGGYQLNAIVQQLKKLDDEEKVQAVHLPLFEKFVGKEA